MILLCNCAGAGVTGEDVPSGVRQRLVEAGAAFEEVADLCGLAARRDPLLRRAAEAPGLRIAACFPRAVRWLFHAAGAPLSEAGAVIVNLRTRGPDEAAAALLDGRQATRSARTPAAASAEQGDSWIPWFPVVDYDRCTNCRQCLGFCLFGAYALSEEGVVEVRNPEKCKTYCPACARVCPEAAIIFPKYNDRPINGDEVRQEDLDKVGVQVDLRSLVAGDVYARLRDRSRPGVPDRFAEAAEQLGVPQEVVDSLRAKCGCSPGGAADCACDESAAGTPASQCDCDCDCKPNP